MAEKILSSRIVHKHDVAANWSKATGFTPRAGELIVYDIDADYSYERIKIGDGTTNVNALPFVDDALRTTLVELINAVDDKVDAVSTLVGDTSVATQITAAISTKADLEHDHDLATTTTMGFMSSPDKAFIEKLKTYTISQMSGKTILDLQAELADWLSIAYSVPNAIASFALDGSFISLWNEGDTTTTLTSGSRWTVELKTNSSDGSYAKLELTSYAYKTVYYINYSNGVWGEICPVAFGNLATSSEDGLMSAEDKTLLDNFRYTDLGSMEGKTVADLQTTLGEWLDVVHDTPNAIAIFRSSTFITQWNEEDTTTILSSGAAWTVELKTYFGAGTYALLELCGYYDKQTYYVAITNNTWSKLRKVFFDSDWESYASTTKAGLMSAADKTKLDGIDEGANKTIVDSELSSTSTNPVQNQAVNTAISNLNTLVGDTSVSEQIAAANIIYVGSTEPTDPNIQVWINTAEEGTGIVPVLPRIATITLAVDSWEGNSAPYSQVVEIATVTSATKIDLQPTVSQIVALQNDDIALMAENIDGVVTIYSFGGKPSADMTMQVQLMEVSYV